MQNNHAVLLKISQKEKAACLLAEAFHHDPMYKLILPEKNKRIQVLFWLFSKIIHYSQLYGEVFATPELTGVACWLPPGETNLSMKRLIRSGLCAVPFKMGWKSYYLFNNYMQYMSKLRRDCAPELHWYLWTIGVETFRQGKGIGSMLLKKILEKVNQDRTACYVQTDSEKNLGFYQRYGFKVVGEEKVLSSKLRVWAMLYEAEDKYCTVHLNT